MVSLRSHLAALMLALLARSAAGADAGPVIDAWIRAQTNCVSWQADFTQTRHLRSFARPLVATGHVWFAAPDRFRWEVRAPAPTVAVRNRDALLVLYPRLRQAERYPLTGAQAGPMSEALALFDAGFPRDRAQFDARFQVVSLAATNAAWVLRLQPASPVTRRLVPAIEVTLATNDFSLLANEITFLDGSRLHNAFTNAALNRAFDPAVFTAEPGPGYTVTEPLRR